VTRASLVRRLADDLAALAARALLRVFFRQVEVVGAERIPRGVPLMILANHVNNLIDPMVIMAFVGGRPRFLAKSTLWSHPVVAPLLLLVAAIPVYRRLDRAPLSRNLHTFARARDVLAAGGTVAVFPEGGSHNEPGPLPLKTGAARIALEAEARHGALGLRVLPVGLVYEDKERFRSRVLVQVGEPIDPAPEAALYTSGPRAAVRGLTARIAAGLEAVTSPFASWEEARLIDRAVDVATEGDPALLPLSRRWALWRTFMARYAAMETADPGRAERLAAALRAYDEARRRLSLRESDLAAWPERGWWPRVRNVMEGAAMAPGVVLNWVPYSLPGWVAQRFTRHPDQPATYKMMAALLAFPAWWALEMALAAWRGGPVAALAILVLAPASGYAALWVRERQRRRPRPVGARFSERASLRDTRAALRRQIREVANVAPW
jgi:glycerol-3-phosphate O-acyltransferase/dihydroxyacetone phosphate acyltransferase